MFMVLLFPVTSTGHCTTAFLKCGKLEMKKMGGGGDVLNSRWQFIWQLILTLLFSTVYAFKFSKCIIEIANKNSKQKLTLF